MCFRAEKVIYSIKPYVLTNMNIKFVLIIAINLVLFRGTNSVIDVQQIADHQCPHTTYVVRYQNESNTMDEVYRTCYDLNTHSTKFTIHTLFPNPKGRSITRLWSNYPLNANIGECYRRNHILNVTYGNFPIYTRGHMTPCGDFSHPTQKMSTLLYVNAVPQLGILNNCDWNNLEILLRQQVPHTGAIVATGSLGILINQYTNQPIYLYDRIGLPIPKWIFKIVSWQIGNERILNAFLGYNWNQTPTENDKNDICSQINCPLNSSIFCCDPVKFIHRHLPTLASTFGV